MQVAGLSMPVEVFHGRACTNVTDEPIARGKTCVVFHAKLGDEEVAKKVFLMEHTAEKTIEAYAKVHNPSYLNAQSLTVFHRKYRETLNCGRALKTNLC